MKYIGIDLGTTNSAICYYDGENTRVIKSSGEQRDITGSAIYIHKNGKRIYGAQALYLASLDPSNAGVLFKRFMGTGEKIEFKDSGVVLSPEECSAELLRQLFGYLPEDLRNEEELGVVITVPASFNQMKKDATHKAATLAGFKNVALVQEPVAAVLSSLKHSKQNGIFIVYDLGGGTFDVTIAEYTEGKVTLSASGGLEFCGGRDIDRAIWSEKVLPWLIERYSLPDNFNTSKEYSVLKNLSMRAIEATKIALSADETSSIFLSEMESRKEDLVGKSISIDIEFSRTELDTLLDKQIGDTIHCTREIMSNAGVTANDIERIVFVGGPTNYKPLREKVCFELALRSDTDLNPMTAVAEGAAIYAETIDWSDENLGNKPLNKSLAMNVDISFNYNARTANDYANIVCFTSSNDLMIAFKNTETGWLSKPDTLSNNAMFELPLNRMGQNTFVAQIYTKNGDLIELPNSKINVEKIIAAIEGIPAPNSIALEVLTKLRGATKPEYLFRQGDPLPYPETTILVKAGESVAMGSDESLNFNLYEGEIDYPISANRLVGNLQIKGTHFSSGSIPVGEEIICTYSVPASGNIRFDMYVPCIESTFKHEIVYIPTPSRTAADIVSDVESVSRQIDELMNKVTDEKLDRAKEKITTAKTALQTSNDRESLQSAENDVLEANKLIAASRKNNREEFRQHELDECLSNFDCYARETATLEELQNFEKLHKTAQDAIEKDSPHFEEYLGDMQTLSIEISWRSDAYVRLLFMGLKYRHRDNSDMNALIEKGEKCQKNSDIDGLRSVILELLNTLPASNDKALSLICNIIGGQRYVKNHMARRG